MKGTRREKRNGEAIVDKGREYEQRRNIGRVEGKERVVKRN